jgi:hypothetical protein
MHAITTVNSMRTTYGALTQTGNRADPRERKKQVAKGKQRVGSGEKAPKMSEEEKCLKPTENATCNSSKAMIYCL